MKKFIMMAVMAIVAISANAQDLDAGEFYVTPKINIGYGVMSNDFKSGLMGGVGVDFEYMTTEKFGVSAGVEFNYFQSDKNTLYVGNDSKEDYYTMGFLNIPILAHLHMGAFAIKAGVQPAFLVAPKAHTDVKIDGSSKSASESVSDLMNSFQFGIPVGISYTFGDNIELGANVTIPVTNVFKGSAVDDGKNTGCMPILISVGYRF